MLRSVQQQRGEQLTNVHFLVQQNTDQAFTCTGKAVFYTKKMLANKPNYSKAEDIRYTKLSVIDSKCGSLLQLSSVLLVFLSISPVYDFARHFYYLKLLYAGLLIACTLCLFILFYKEQTSETFVTFRKIVFNIAVVITSACCLAIMWLVMAIL